MNDEDPRISRRAFLQSGFCNVSIASAGCLQLGDRDADDSRDNGREPRELDDSDLELAFEDTFDEEALDEGKWQTSYPWGAREHNYNGYASAENVSVTDGTLNLIAEEERENGEPYKTGIVSPLQSFSSGYVEGYIKPPPARPGFWPAFWLTSTSRWPPEIDVFEFFGSDPRAWMTYHYVDADGDKQKAQKAYGGSDFSDRFHLYSVDWTPQRIIWAIDGEERFRYDGDYIRTDDMWLIINFGIDPDFLESPSSADLPARIEVESVRVWEHTEHTDDGGRSR